MLKDKCKILNANEIIMYTSLALLYEGSNNERGDEAECLKPTLSIHFQAAFVWFCPTVGEWDKSRVYAFFNLSKKKYTVSYRYYES